MVRSIYSGFICASWNIDVRTPIICIIYVLALYGPMTQWLVIIFVCSCSLLLIKSRSGQCYLLLFTEMARWNMILFSCQKFTFDSETTGSIVNLQ